jgi:predicted ATPase
MGTITTLMIIVILNVGHFISAAMQPFFIVLSGLYIVYNIRKQIVNEGGLKNYLKGWLKWKK